MDKNAIKKFAIWARRELIARVSQKAEQYGITKEYHGDADAERVGERLLTRTEQSQRKNLINRIEQEGYQQVMEEVAYTWFNRFIALRFMEVNGYLPTRIRVFTDEENAFKPQILAEAIHMELDGLDMEKVYAFKEKNQTEELYKYLLITQCNALSRILPGMFQTISDYTELLFPDNLLREGSVIEQMVALIPECDWQDQVQIIGWLYQYYNTEPKDQVFANLKKNIKIGKNDIPAATQLFTPDWIVRYMVENSLGRLWVEGHPDEALKSNWKYYLEEAEQEPEVQAQLAEIRKAYAGIKPEDIRCIDPCMGSGHILCYLFDVLMQIYEAYGYSTREAVQSIVENNLYGLDIDDRAAQLAYFAVMMKARQYDRRFFTRGIQTHVMAIQESNTLEAFDHLQAQLSLDNMCVETANQLIRTFRDAKEYGSILDVNIPYLDTADRLMEQLRAIDGDFELMAWIAEAEELLPVLAKQAAIMQQKYDVVVTNPPYMGSSGMSAKLSDFVKANYPDSKSDASTCFMERTIGMCNENGYMAMINIPVWMFLSSYEKLRNNMITQNTFVNMVHPGRGIFGSDFGTTSFVIGKQHVSGYRGSYRRLFQKQGEVESIEEREQAFLNGVGCFTAQQDNFAKIPGSPVAYWVSDSFLHSFEVGVLLGEIADAKQGLATSDNDRFVRYWYEPHNNSINYTARSIEQAKSSHQKWFPYNKGGEFRKWYGNNDFVVNWEKDGYEIKHVFDGKGKLRSRPQNTNFYFRACFSWSLISSSVAAFRYKPYGQIFDVAGMSCFSEKHLYYLLALCNSNVAMQVLSVIAPTINYQCGDIAEIPVIINNDMHENIRHLTETNINVSQIDWDSYETSWDFKRNPMVGRSVTTVAKAYALWAGECNTRFAQLKANEEELNRIFIDIYGLQDELTPEVADKDVTVHRVFDSKDDVPESMKGSAYVRTMRDEIVSLISYAVGCMFGRYSLDVDGLAYAGGGWDSSKYKTFIPDKDGILPITDDEYFDDDIVGRFVEFIRTVYGEDTLEENLKFVADALGGKGAPRQVIRDYFLNDFYADHLKTYQKRPIYWLFDSGKKNGFKCLIYMHRYAPDTIARIRTDYVHEQQSRYRTAIADLEKRIANASTAERVKLTRQLAGIQAQADELHIYEEKIHHYADQMIPIDLDDGVKVNYAKFADVLAKIK